MIRIRFSQFANKIDPELFEYCMSYFDDSSNDFSRDGLLDFLSPILPLSKDDMDSLLDSLVKLTIQSSEPESAVSRKLETEFKMVDLGVLEKKKVDLTHTNRHTGKSNIDEKKLREAELRLIKKREARGKWLDSDGIPLWNPDIKPDIIVNQAKPQTDSRSKDVKIENFDISFAGKKILIVKLINIGCKLGLKLWSEIRYGWQEWYRQINTIESNRPQGIIRFTSYKDSSRRTRGYRWIYYGHTVCSRC